MTSNKITITITTPLLAISAWRSFKTEPLRVPLGATPATAVLASFLYIPCGSPPSTARSSPPSLIFYLPADLFFALGRPSVFSAVPGYLIADYPSITTYSIRPGP